MCFGVSFFVALAIVSSWYLMAGKACSEGDVFFRFREQIFPNNSYFLYSSITSNGRNHLYCYTSKKICCNDSQSNWYLPSGERVLGGYEYDDIRVGVFARSSGFRSQGLYRHYSPQQRGRFSCVIPDAYGDNCTLFANIVDQIPAITAQPISQTVRAGQNTTFSIEVSNGNFASYRWQHDNVDLMDDSVQYQGSTTTVLTIFSTNDENEGSYRCIVDDILVSEAAELSVVNEPFVIPNTITELNAISGHDLEFSFDTDIDSDAAVTFYWQKDEHTIMSDGHKYKGTTTQTLTIFNIQKSDEGVYSLNFIMADPANISMGSFNVSISVVSPSIEINSSITPELGVQCNLTCNVRGVESYNSIIAYQWFKDGVMILNATNSVLVMQSLDHIDAGEYMCTVNLTSEKLIPSFISNESNTYLMCFAMDIAVTLAGSSIDNESLIYFDEISKQESTSALNCHINNIIICGNGINNSQTNSNVEWYFPNGDLVPRQTATQTTSMFSQRSLSLSGTELHRLGHPFQTGPYFCTVPKYTSVKFYVFIRSHVSLSLRGVTIYNNSKVNLDDIGGSRDDEALQCHTDLVSCCDNELTENASALAEWYYPNGSKVSSVDRGIDDSNNVNETHFSSCGFFTSRSQSMIRLLASRGTGSTEIGQHCCKIQDQYRSSQTLCVNLVSDYINETEPDVICRLPKTQNHSDTTNGEQPCSSSPKEDDINVSVVIYGQGSASVGHSFSMNCTVAGINDSGNLSIAHQWYKDNHPIQGAGLSTLHFNALTLMDAGSYVCEVSIRSRSQRSGIIRSTLPYILNISSVLFQIRLYSVQNCIQWTSSDVISRIEDIENAIVSSLRKHCQCKFSRSDITDEGFQCFTGSESHVTFRAQLQQSNQKSSLELVSYLKDIVNNTHYWLIHGQYLQVNHSCSLVITNVHSPECPQVENNSTSNPPSVMYGEPNHNEQGIVISCSVGYLTWALSSTLLLLILVTVFGVLLSAKALKSKVFKTLGQRNSDLEMRARSNTHDINTDANNTYNQEEAYQEMKQCSMNDQYPDDDYEEIRNIAKEANNFDY